MSVMQIDIPVLADFRHLESGDRGWQTAQWRCSAQRADNNLHGCLSSAHLCKQEAKEVATRRWPGALDV